MKTVTFCPVLGCPWSIETTPPTTGDHVLAEVFGPGIMAAHHRNTVAIDNERKAEAHLKGHSVIEWVNTVNALREAYAGAIAQVVEVTEAFTRAGADRKADEA